MARHRDLIRWIIRKLPNSRDLATAVARLKIKMITNPLGYHRYSAIVTRDMENLPERAELPEELFKLFMSDYTRHASLELAMREIKRYGVGGAAAEVGVYQGDFARLIHFFLPDRRLYLFDTFQGFNQADLKADAYTLGQDFSATSVETVLQKMKHRERCVVRVGRFPESAEGVEDRFCLVSLDADLYNPIYTGLRYFWPRLNAGGYIFVHDYNNGPYPGVRQAVEKFAEEEAISGIAIPDWGGTFVLAKPWAMKNGERSGAVVCGVPEGRSNHVHTDVHKDLGTSPNPI